jgi:hypothetical protein
MRAPDAKVEGLRASRVLMQQETQVRGGTVGRRDREEQVSKPFPDPAGRKLARQGLLLGGLLRWANGSRPRLGLLIRGGGACGEDHRRPSTGGQRESSFTAIRPMLDSARARRAQP